jgi:hypothetical protein
MTTEIFEGSQDVAVEPADARYGRKPDGTADQGKKED